MNKAELDLENIMYDIFIISETSIERPDCIVVYNPYQIKIRTDKILAEILGVTRSNIKQAIKEGKIKICNDYAGNKIEIFISVFMQE